MAALLFRIERASEGTVKVCRNAHEIAAAIEAGVLATVLHIEGADTIDPRVPLLSTASTRPGCARSGSSGAVRRSSRRASRSGSREAPTPAPGLTDLRMGAGAAAATSGRILIDLSHLNEAGFWDVAKLSDAPLVATHSNAHAITPHSAQSH